MSSTEDRTATLAKRNVVTPPRTGLGTGWGDVSCWSAHDAKGCMGHLLARKKPETLPRIPNSMRKPQHQRPAERLAQRVIAMTPLFCGVFRT